MVNLIRISFVILSAVFVLSACTGKSKDAEKPEAPEKAAEQAAPAPAPEAATAEKEKSDGKDSMKDRAGTAYAALHCSGALADPDSASDAYKEHGFKGPKHFMKVWSLYAKKDSEWAHTIATDAEKSDCKK